MPSASSCLLHVLCFAEYPYQTESKRDKNERSLFLEYLENLGERSTRNGVRGGHEAGAHAHTRRARPHPRGPPVRPLMPFFGRKKANFWKKKSRRRFQSNRSYGSPYIYIYETVKGQQNRTQKQRDRSHLGGAFAPPTPWRPWTRGETLLPSREEVKEEE